MSGKKVYQFDLKGELIREHESQTNAARSVGAGDSTVAEHVRTGSKTPCYGYFWSKDKDFKVNGTHAQPVKTPPVKKKSNGIPLEKFRLEHDIDLIVQRALDSLDPDMMYEKKDVIALTGKSVGYVGLSTTLEAATEYKGRSGGTSYWSHPDTIKELKSQGILS